TSGVHSFRSIAESASDCTRLTSYRSSMCSRVSSAEPTLGCPTMSSTFGRVMREFCLSLPRSYTLFARTRGVGPGREGDRVSDEPQRLGASGDIIGALSDRVTELTKRAASLESDLDSARKRIAVYEEFDATVREAMAGTLRAAHQIRTRAEGAAQQILEQARERSEEHTSELQSRGHLVCRLLL